MTWLDRYLQRARICKAAPYIAPGSRVLDIGCADGRLFQQFPFIGEGVGIDPDLWDCHPSMANVRFYKGLFPAALPDDRPFDTITMLAVLEHVPNHGVAQLAVDCARYLKPGGHLIVTVPSPLVDYILAVLVATRLVKGMSLEQHHGYDPRKTPNLFSVGGLALVRAKRFQLGLNNLFVFRQGGKL